MGFSVAGSTLGVSKLCLCLGLVWILVWGQSCLDSFADSRQLLRGRDYEKPAGTS